MALAVYDGTGALTEVYSGSEDFLAHVAANLPKGWGSKPASYGETMKALAELHDKLRVIDAEVDEAMKKALAVFAQESEGGGETTPPDRKGHKK